MCSPNTQDHYEVLVWLYYISNGNWNQYWIPVHNTDQHKYEFVVEDAFYWSMSEGIYNLYTFWLANEQRLYTNKCTTFSFYSWWFRFLYSNHLDNFIILVLPRIINSIVHSYSSVNIMFYVLFSDISTKTHTHIYIYIFRHGVYIHNSCSLLLSILSSGTLCRCKQLLPLRLWGGLVYASIRLNCKLDKYQQLASESSSRIYEHFSS